MNLILSSLHNNTQSVIQFSEKKKRKMVFRENEKLKKVSRFYKIFTEYYYKTLDDTWNKIPRFLGTLIATVIVFIAGSTLRGDWLLIMVHFIRSVRTSENGIEIENNEIEDDQSLLSLERFRLQGLSFFLIMNFFISYTFYFFICGFLQWYFYIRQHDTSENWKCQPKKFLTPELERHEIITGTINVGVGSLVFGTLACYIYNGGHTLLYFKLNEYGWLWLFASIPLLFIYQDGAAYYGHRFMHIRFFYRHFHKMHHYYRQPTAFSTTAFHPFELLFFQSLLIFPALIVPLHVVIYVGILFYIYYYGLIGHSGVKLDGLWPWQPDTIFHDNHHQYININFGFNMLFWDKFHGTYHYIDNSRVGKTTKPDPGAFRTSEETDRLEREYINGDN